MTINLSASAKQEVLRWKAASHKFNAHLRVGVRPGGCAGWLYTLELDNSLREEEILIEANGVTVAISPDDRDRLAGLAIDYSEDLMGGSFRFDCPQATSTCGCGYSVSLE